MSSRLIRQPGIHCPTQNLFYAIRFEQIRFNYFTNASPNLEKRDEAGTLINLYTKRIFEEHGVVINDSDSK